MEGGESYKVQSRERLLPSKRNADILQQGRALTSLEEDQKITGREATSDDADRTQNCQPNDVAES